MPSKPIELAVARRIVEDMRAYLDGKKQIRQDEIAGKLGLTDVKRRFVEMKDHAWAPRRAGSASGR